MNQAEIIKGLLVQYRDKGGDMTNAEAASAYVTAHKPQGVGRTSPVICAALIKQLPPPPMTDQAPPPPAIVIATATAPVPETVEPFAVYREIEQSESTPVAPVPALTAEHRETVHIPVPPPKPEPVQKEPPPVEPAKTGTKVKEWISKLKFWKKK